MITILIMNICTDSEIEALLSRAAAYNKAIK